MTLESEIIKTKEILQMNGSSKIIAMHCVSDYPTLDKNLNLNYLKNYIILVLMKLAYLITHLMI